MNNGIPQAEPPVSYQRLGGTGSAYMPTPSGPTVAKVDALGWKIVDQPGRFRQIEKAELRIDHAYQRTNIQAARVNRIAGKWSWLKFGCLVVAERSDSTLWVLDGQHRKLAADKRADIGKLPCLVFAVDEFSDEALAFLGINADRGAVKMTDKYKSLIAGGDDLAVSVKEMVEASGLTISHSTVPGKVKCVAALMKAMKEDAASCRVAFDVAAYLCGQSHAIHDNLFTGLFFAERHIKKCKAGSLADAHNLDALARAGIPNIEQSINESRVFFGNRPGSRGEGIIRVINKGRRSRRIPSILTVEPQTQEPTEGVE